MLERVKEDTQRGKYTHVEWVRWADDIVILVDAHAKWKWLKEEIQKRLERELEEIEVTLNKRENKDREPRSKREL